MSLRWVTVALTCLPPLALAVNKSPNGYHNDPYIQFQPPYAYSLPIQILLTGMVVALVFVLFVQLLFTAQSHWPLAKLNYTLQLSGVSTLLLSQVATLVVVLRTTYHRSRSWPYMLDYIAVSVPITDPPKLAWNSTQLGCWYLMQAVTSGLVNVSQNLHFTVILLRS